jgi:hypothetical protein
LLLAVRPGRKFGRCGCDRYQRHSGAR